jgi:hypothetical protein
LTPIANRAIDGRTHERAVGRAPWITIDRHRSPSITDDQGRRRDIALDPDHPPAKSSPS